MKVALILLAFIVLCYAKNVVETKSEGLKVPESDQSKGQTNKKALVIFKRV
jgi:hypothetical protein